MKKRILPILLAIFLLAALSACSGHAPQDDSGRDHSTAGSDASEEIPADGVQSQPAETLGEFNVDATLAETVLLDEGGVRITANGLSYTAYSVDLELTIENNSGKNLSFVSGSLGYSCNSVNGYMVNDGYLNCDVANGKKANDTIQFSYDGLMLYGIDEIADMEIGFSMTDSEYNTTYSGLRQLKTSAVETHDYGTDHYQNAITSGAVMNTYGYEMMYFSQDSLYDQNGVTLLSSGVITRRDGKTVLLLELENTTDSMVYLSTADIAINGLVVNSSTWSSDAINPGKRCIVDIDLSSVFEPDNWSVYGITEVGRVSVLLGQRNEEGIEIAAETPVEIVVPDASVAFDVSGTEVYNSNGLKIVLKAVMEDPTEGSSDVYVLLLAENSSGKTLTIDDVYHSLSVNDCMTDYSYYSQTLSDGASAALTIKLQASSLEKNQIESASDIQKIEVGIEINEGYTTIAEPILTLVPGE